MGAEHGSLGNQGCGGGQGRSARHVESKDIAIALQEQLLTIKGEKKQEKEEKDERHHRMERSYGAFTRSIRLPVGVDGSKVTAVFKNGLLTVTLPKTAAAKGTTIPIKADS